LPFDKWLADNGYDAATLTDTSRRHLLAAWRDETQPAPAPAPAASDTTPEVASLDEKFAAIEAENDRVSKIREASEKAALEAMGNGEKIRQIRDLAKAAIEDKKADYKTFSLHLLRLSRSCGPLILAPKSQPVSNDVLEAAVCMAGKLGSVEKEFDANTLEQAHSQFKGGIGLLELVSIVAAHNGYRTSSAKRDLRNTLRAAFSPHSEMMSASVGASTLDISGILSNIANKYVRESFMFVEQAWREISAIRPVTDFKTITTYSLTGDNTYDKVAPGGEIKHGTLGETSYTNRADTYAKLIGIDRRDYINDDLSALSNAGKRLGRGGAQKLNDVFWTEFLDNSSFFTSGRGNYDDGASDTLMDLTGLNNAHQLFMALTDPDGKPLGVDPRICLIPPALKASAWTYLMARPGGDTTATISPWAGMYKLVESRYLSNSSFTGYSAKAWYLLADPNDLPVIETCFLNGAEMPTIETAEMDFDRLGTALRGYHDFGVSKQEYRAGVKLKGEA
jgi:hypothetical protein